MMLEVTVFCVFGLIFLAMKCADRAKRKRQQERRSTGGNGGSAYVGGRGIAIGGRGGSGDQRGEDGIAITEGNRK